MDTFDKGPLVVPFFYTTTIENPEASKKAGRPIFDELEMVEVRIAGERNHQPHFPAHSMWIRENDEEITYAMRWGEEYRQFKETGKQTAHGTPLDELTFLTAARRSELKALKIYTAEALAALDGPQLKVLAGEGYKLKEQAQAYLDKANSFSSVTALAAENAELRERLASLERPLGNIVEPVLSADDETSPDPYEGLEDADLKDKIENLTGVRPRGNPNRQSLIRTLDDIQSQEAA